MPILLAPPLAFALGVLFSWAAENELTRSTNSLLTSHALQVVISFSLLIFLPCFGYFLWFAPDWTLVYFIDTRHVSSALLLVLALTVSALLVAGFTVGAWCVRHKHTVALLPWMTVPLALGAIAVTIASRRLSVYGTYIQVKRGLGAAPLAGSTTGVAIVWLTTCLSLAAAWTTHQLRRSSH